jgi:competence protein ComFB
VNTGQPVKVQNANSEKVNFYLDKMLSEVPGYCGCSRCRMDSAALALNTLPPHYYVNPEQVKAQDLGSPWLLIDVAVREAMDKVRKFPHHAIKDRDLPVIDREEIDHADFNEPLAAEDTGTDG